jgi:hypothetical protein
MSLQQLLEVILSRQLVRVLALFSLVGLAACSLPRKYNYDEENFSSNNTYSRSYPGSAKSSCEAARRSLLSQGYIIDDVKASQVKGHKNFQPESDVHMQIAFNVDCEENSKGSNSATVFASAVNDRYSLRKSSNSASLGVGALGSLSLPIGSSDDALVKVASETISAKKFYESFFSRLESFLDIPADFIGKDAAAPAPAQQTQ